MQQWRHLLQHGVVHRIVEHIASDIARLCIETVVAQDSLVAQVHNPQCTAASWEVCSSSPLDLQDHTQGLPEQKKMLLIN